MSEEIRNNVEVEALVPAEEYEYGYNEDFEEEEGGGLVKGLIVAGGTVIVGGATALAVKNRDRIAAWKLNRDIKKLEKKGFTVIDPEDLEEAEAVEVVEEETKKKSEKKDK